MEDIQEPALICLMVKELEVVKPFSAKSILLKIIMCHIHH